MNLLKKIDQVDSVLPADGWRPARRGEDSIIRRQERQAGGRNHWSYIIRHYSFFIWEEQPHNLNINSVLESN